MLLAAASSNIEGWTQVGELALAVALAAIIGAEREVRQKSAGLRTHTLVGLGAALFTLVSKYGFSDVLTSGNIRLDPSRVASLVVSGIGFVGAGLIFVRRNSVRGLTTAVTVWVAAAVGVAAGAGLPVLAAVGTGFYLVVALLFPFLGRHLPAAAASVLTVRLQYPDGRGLLRLILERTTDQGFAVDEVSTEFLGHRRPAGSDGEEAPMIAATLQVHGAGSVRDLAAALSELQDVEAIAADDRGHDAE